MPNLRVGLIGFGLAGESFHAPIIRGVPGMELACILQRHGSRAHEAYPDVRIARSLEDLLSDESIRLCVVATPNQSHLDLARRCLLAGRDVVVDKPFTTTVAEAVELVRLARQQKRLLTVYQNRRWDGDFQTVIKIVNSGALGRVVEYEARYERFRPNPPAAAGWRDHQEPGSGILFDLGPHLIDQALFLFGAPQFITASVFTQRDWAKADDSFDICLQYPGVRATLRSRMLAYAPAAHFRLYGTNGSFVKYGMDPQEAVLRGGGELPQGTDWGPHWGEEPERLWGTLAMADGGSGIERKVKTERGDYRGFYANVRDAILQGIPPAVTLTQALRTMQTIELARQSSREQRTLPWVEVEA
jgi:predicted dehydrogenase